MADPVLRLSYKDATFVVGKMSAQELIQVGKWTGFNRRRSLEQAILDEDPTALVAVFAIARRRAGELDVSYSDVDVDLDEVKAALIDEQGREIEPVFETNADGTLKLGEETDADGKVKKVPLPVIVDKQVQYRYVDTGEAVPPTSSVGTPSPDTSATLGDSSVSV